MVFEPEFATVIHNYSDKLTENSQNIPIYSINEVLAEKLRALIQRSYSAPRDFFDIWYLSRNVENINWEDVLRGFYEKIRYKKLPFYGVQQIINNVKDNILKSAWKNSLQHQITDGELPEYEVVRNDIERLLKVIFEIKNK